MELVVEYFELMRKVLLNPDSFFEEESRFDGFKYPMQFAFLSMLFSGLILTVNSLFYTTFSSSVTEASYLVTVFSGAALSIFIITVGGIISLFLISGLLHLFVKVLNGKKGFRETVAVMEYATAISPVTALISLIPSVGFILSFLIGFYSLYIQLKGIEKLHLMETERAAFAVVTPMAIVFLIGLIFTMLTSVGFGGGSFQVLNYLIPE